MSISYHDLAAAVAVRINALGNPDIPEFAGTDPAQLQIVYSARPLVNEMFGSSIFPFNAIRDSIIQAQGKLARAIALSDNRPARADLRSETSALVSGADLPSVDSAGLPIIGNFGAVLDGTDQTTVCTRMPVAVVRNRLLSPGIFLAPAYYFALDNGQILHTRTTVILECCVYSSTVQTDRFNRNLTIPLSDDLAEAIICGACAMLVRDDEFSQQAQLWGTYFTTTLANYPPAKMEAQAA